MFNLLFTRYKQDVLDTSVWKSIKELSLYEKAIIIICFLSSLLTSTFSLWGKSYYSVFSASIMVACVPALWILRKSEKRKKKTLEDIERRANTRTVKIINLLKEFGIDYNNPDEISKLVDYAKKERQLYDTGSGMSDHFKLFGTYVVVPILAILLAEYFKDAKDVQLLVRALIIILIGFAAVLLISSFSMLFNEFLNINRNYLDILILDIEEVSVFSNKARELC